MINNKSYIHIGGWMLNELHLKWSELIIYATIFSFTNGTEDHCFHWSSEYLSERAWVSRRQTTNSLRNLEKKWLIFRKEREINWVKFVDYYTNFPGWEKTSQAPGKNFPSYNRDNNSISYSSINTTIQEEKVGLLDINQLYAEEKEKNPAKKEKEITVAINWFISDLRAICKDYWVAYDKTRERMFAKHILTAKDYGEFAESIGQGRIEFAENVLIVSIKAGYWKGPLTGPMKIYQNYADLYNWAKAKFEKKVTPHIEVL